MWIHLGVKGAGWAMKQILDLVLPCINLLPGFQCTRVPNEWIFEKQEKNETLCFSLYAEKLMGNGAG